MPKCSSVLQTEKEIRPNLPEKCHFSTFLSSMLNPNFAVLNLSYVSLSLYEYKVNKIYRNSKITVENCFQRWEIGYAGSEVINASIT